MTAKKRDFFDSLGTYLGVIAMLAVINLMTNRLANPWFLWPAMGWGLAIFLKGWRLWLSDDEEETAETIQIDEIALMHNSKLDTYLNQAYAYKEQIKQLGENSPRDNNKERLSSLLEQINEWVQSIEQLAQQVAKFENNAVLKEDLIKVPQAIAELEERIGAENDPSLQNAMNRTLQNRQAQLHSLQELARVSQRAEIQIESTLSSLGTIYSQMLTGESTSQIADYRRLSHEAEEETRALQDYLTALDEIRLGDSD